MSDIKQMPIDVLLSEKRSHRDRMLKDVMQALWGMMPPQEINTKERVHDFVLPDGTKCWLRRFSSPFERDGVLRYAFDVWFEDGKPLNHIEFTVKSSGFGGGCLPPAGKR